MASSTTNWKSREDYKKQKELEEARKAGTALPETDEEGKEINPHIPQYIAQAPWYLNNTGPSLKHQRQFKVTTYDNTWYTRGAFKAPPPKKWRDGSCTNCGAATHDRKSCTERPRKLGAKWTQSDMRPDEVIQEITLDYDGKRDRWNGYDPSNHTTVVDKYDKIAQERKQQKSEALNAIAGKSELSKSGDLETEEGEAAAEAKKPKEEEDDEDEEEDEETRGFKETEGYNNAPITKVDPRTRTTIRNLRIREDTAKYLRNLDLNSAFYDPKTRSMRENPNPASIPLEEQVYSGDNFVRNTGEAKKFNDMQGFSWEAYEKGQELHVEATPSQALLLYEQYKEKKEHLKQKQKESIIGKYGGEEYLNSLPKELVFSQTENYTEYARDGKLVKGQEKVVVRTKYEEDVYLNNHTAVWGSYWESGNWGFACCRQILKNSYCTGEAGRLTKEEIQKQMKNSLNTPKNKEKEAEKAQTEATPEKKQKPKEKDEKGKNNLLKKFGDEDTLKEKNLDEERLRKAIREEDRRREEHLDERKRQYNSLSGDSYEVTEEQMEAWRLKKHRFDDPMRNMLEEPEAGLGKGKKK
eukprot:TRINITY_DN5793_c0_g3_i1.p1 TRINITY_DN5793_c0_g3~~TRINITY_DN5793_c0_g3_i1.p1  ORF type:complete len:581 (+),score=216.57 TRINITY_DN5793_c0_g3_i1:173-1915(+)